MRIGPSDYVHYCVLLTSRVRVRVGVRIRFSVWLVRGYAHVFVLVSIVIVTLPYKAVAAETGFVTDLS